MLQHLFWYLRLIKTHTSPSTAASRWLSWLENSCQGLGLLQCALRSPTCLGPGLGVGKVRAPDWYVFFLMLMDQASELIYMHVSQARWTYFRDLCLHFGPGGLAGL